MCFCQKNKDTRTEEHKANAKKLNKIKIYLLLIMSFCLNLSRREWFFDRMPEKHKVNALKNRQNRKICAFVKNKDTRTEEQKADARWVYRQKENLYLCTSVLILAQERNIKLTQWNSIKYLSVLLPILSFCPLFPGVVFF